MTTTIPRVSDAIEAAVCGPVVHAPPSSTSTLRGSGDLRSSRNRRQLGHARRPPWRRQHGLSPIVRILRKERGLGPEPSTLLSPPLSSPLPIGRVGDRRQVSWLFGCEGCGGGRRIRWPSREESFAASDPPLQTPELAVASSSSARSGRARALSGADSGRRRATPCGSRRVRLKPPPPAAVLLSAALRSGRVSESTSGVGRRFAVSCFSRQQSRPRRGLHRRPVSSRSTTGALRVESSYRSVANCPTRRLRRPTTY